MDLGFCSHWQGDGSHGDQRTWCRRCPARSQACDGLWAEVVRLARAGNGVGTTFPADDGAREFRLLPPKGQQEIVHLRVNSSWNLPMEDLLHFVRTGGASSGTARVHDDPGVAPSKTYQARYLRAIVERLEREAPEALAAVRLLPRKQA